MKKVDIICTFNINNIIKFVDLYRNRANIVLTLSAFNSELSKEYSTIGLIDNQSIIDLLDGFAFYICTITLSSCTMNNIKMSNSPPFKIDPWSIFLKDISITRDIYNNIEIKTKSCFGDEQTATNVNIGMGPIDRDYWKVNLEKKQLEGSLR